jgi:tRNA-binding EMAP/Myf-like protein
MCQRVAVAPVGSTIVNEEGEEIEIKKTAVGGVMSEGMLCDSRMLGWSGGAEGIAAQIPDSVEIGASPPSSKPRPKEEVQSELAPASNEDSLFKKKLTKEEKKKLAEEKKNARKAAKEAKKEESSSS